MIFRDTLFLSAAIILGFAVHGYLTWPLPALTPAPIDTTNATMKATVLAREPKGVSVGNTSLVAVPTFAEQNGNLSLRWDCFQLDNGRLVNVPLGVVAPAAGAVGN